MSDWTDFLPYFATRAQLFAVRRKTTPLYRTNRDISIIGNSISAQNHNTALTGTQSRDIGFMAQAHALARGAWNFGPDLNFGVSGDTTALVLARAGANSLASLVARQPARCAVLLGTNDISGDVARNTIITNLRTIWSTINDGGIPVDAIPVLPRSYSMTGARRSVLQWLNEMIYEEQFRRDPALFSVLDAGQAIQDKSSSTAAEIANSLSDNLHPSAYGAELIAINCVKPYYDSFFPAPAVNRTPARTATYDATNNPNGALNAYPIPTGTSGTAGAGSSGSVATGLNVVRSVGSTLTLTCSVTTPDGTGSGQAQEIALGGPGSGANNETAYCSTGNFTIPTTIVAGTKLLAVADVEVSGLANVRNVNLTFNHTANSVVTTYRALSAGAVTTDRIAAATRKLLQCPVAIAAGVSGDTGNLSIYITTDSSGTAASGTVRIRSIALIPIN